MTFSTRLFATCCMAQFVALVTVLFVATFSVVGSAADVPVEFRIQANSQIHQDAPISVPLPPPVRVSEPLTLVNVSSSTRVPCQRNEDGTELVFLLDATLDAEESRRYRIDILAEPGNENSVTCHADEDAVTLGFPDREVLSYHVGVVEPPAGAHPLYRRSGHIHPFITPQGRIVTESFPSDHLHQHAIFAAWTKTTFEGERVDFWNQKAGTGTVGHRAVLQTTSGPVFASFRAQLMHTVTKGDPVDVVEEQWTVRLYHVRNVHIFDLESVQTCIAQTPLTLEEYHYGGFAVRGAAQWIDNDKHHIVTNETADRKIGNHTRPLWASIYGPLDGEHAGVAMMSHPTNFRSPQPVRLHPSMPYFVYSPVVLGSFDLNPGEPYRSRYRYIAFDGQPNSELLDRLWKDYSVMPKIEWLTADE